MEERSILASLLIIIGCLLASSDGSDAELSPINALFYPYVFTITIVFFATSLRMTLIGTHLSQDGKLITRAATACLRWFSCCCFVVLQDKDVEESDDIGKLVASQNSIPKTLPSKQSEEEELSVIRVGMKPQQLNTTLTSAQIELTVKGATVKKHDWVQNGIAGSSNGNGNTQRRKDSRENGAKDHGRRKWKRHFNGTRQSLLCQLGYTRELVAHTSRRFRRSSLTPNNFLRFFPE